MFAKTVFLLALAAVITAQTTCPCRAATGGVCNTIRFDEEIGGASTCIAGTTDCSECFCSQGGPLTCSVASASAFVFNGTANFCEIETISVASCPDTTPQLPVNVSTCCSQTGVAASPTNTCSLESAPSLTGGATATAVYTVVSYDSNLSGVYNNQGTSINAFSASSSYDTIYGSGFPAGLPTLYFNNLDTTTTTATTVLQAGQSTEYFEEFSGTQPAPQTFLSGSTEFNQVLAYQPTIVFPYEITIFQSSTTGSTQTTRWTITHCMYVTILQ